VTPRISLDTPADLEKRVNEREPQRPPPQKTRGQITAGGKAVQYVMMRFQRGGALDTGEVVVSAGNVLQISGVISTERVA